MTSADAFKPEEPLTEDPLTEDPRPDGLRNAKSLLLVNTGNGKGKSSAAFGVMIRGVARGWNVAVLQFVIAIYGGFFGGGIGILMLATLALMGETEIHVMNALKTVLGSIINGVAVLVFVLNGMVIWPQAIVMVVGAIIGGYYGAEGARKIAPSAIRTFVIVIGLCMSAYFFYRYR